jgi:hypothetical protein
MNQNYSENWSFFVNPTAAQITGIVHRIINYKRRVYVMIIGDEPGHYGELIGIVVFNIGGSLN